MTEEKKECEFCGGTGAVELSPARQEAGEIRDAEIGACQNCKGTGNKN
jgi:hypothetical protein